MDTQRKPSTVRHQFDTSSRCTIRLVENEQSSSELNRPPELPLTRTSTDTTVNRASRETPASDFNQEITTPNAFMHLPTDGSGDGEHGIQPNGRDRPKHISGYVIDAFRNLLRSDLRQGEQKSDDSIEALAKKAFGGIKQKNLGPRHRKTKVSDAVRCAISSDESRSTYVNDNSSSGSRWKNIISSRETPPISRSDSVTNEEHGRPGIDIPVSQANVIRHPITDAKSSPNPFRSLFDKFGQRPLQGRRLRHVLFGNKQRKQPSEDGVGGQREEVESSLSIDTPLPFENPAPTIETSASVAPSESQPQFSNNARSATSSTSSSSSNGGSSVATGPSNPTSFIETVQQWLQTPPIERRRRSHVPNEHETSHNARPNDAANVRRSRTSAHYIPMPPNEPPHPSTTQVIHTYQTKYITSRPNSSEPYEYTTTTHVYPAGSRPYHGPPHAQLSTPNLALPRHRNRRTTMPNFPTHPFPAPTFPFPHQQTYQTPTPRLNRRSMPTRYPRARQHQPQHHRQLDSDLDSVNPSIPPRSHTIYQHGPRVYVPRRRRFSESDVDFEADEEGDGGVQRRKGYRRERRGGSESEDEGEGEGRYRLDLGPGWP